MCDCCLEAVIVYVGLLNFVFKVGLITIKIILIVNFLKIKIN